MELKKNLNIMSTGSFIAATPNRVLRSTPGPEADVPGRGDHAKRGFILVLVAGVALLVWFSIRLALSRLLQVDECQVVFVSRILATGQTNLFLSGVSPFLALLALLGHGAARSADIFTSARLVMVAIFWLNLLLITLATGERLFSLRGLVALAGAATLAPLWDYGFEIRNDNLLLAGILLTWYLVRVRSTGWSSYFAAGAIAMVLEFSLFKAFVYTIPISLAILAVPPPRYTAPRWRLWLAWLCGAASILLLLRVVYGLAGLWDLYLSDFHRVAGDASGGNRFGPWLALRRLPGQTPLLLALTFAAFAGVALDMRRRGKAALTWDGNLPEALLVVLAIAALAINPDPFPYNLLHLVPYAFVFAFRYAAPIGRALWNRAAARPTVVTLVFFTHLVPFVVATSRHSHFTNTRQFSVMRLAEDLTDPAKDPVYDGIGLVPTRPSIHHDWFLHSLNIRKFTAGTGMRVRDMLAARPAAVLIPSYRTDWLTDEDHAFIRDHYVPLADDCWVLGNVSPMGGGAFEIIHPGRYHVAAGRSSELTGSQSGNPGGKNTSDEEPPSTCILDGVRLVTPVVDLSAGTHRVETAPGLRANVVWLGPRLTGVPQLKPGSHTVLFVNWY